MQRGRNRREQGPADRVFPEMGDQEPDLFFGHGPFEPGNLAREFLRRRSVAEREEREQAAFDRQGAPRGRREVGAGGVRVDLHRPAREVALELAEA